MFETEKLTSSGDGLFFAIAPLLQLKTQIRMPTMYSLSLYASVDPTHYLPVPSESAGGIGGPI